MKNKFVFLLALFVSLIGTLHAQKSSKTVAPNQLIPARAQTNGVVYKRDEKKFYSAMEALEPGTEIIRQQFKDAAYGDIPAGWTDLLYRRPSRNWMVDAHGFLRHVLKNRNNKLTYEPFSNSFLESPTTPTRPGLIVCDKVNDRSLSGKGSGIRIQAEFKKTEDEDVFFGIAGRVKDRRNFYAVMLRGGNRLSIAKVQNDSIIPLTDIVSLNRYRYPEKWKLTAVFRDDLVTGILYNERGEMVARADARDAEFTGARFGLYCTDYAASSWVSATILGSSKEINSINSNEHAQNPVYNSYKLIKPVESIEPLNSDISQVKDEYDIIVAGAGTGGWAAAVQAARMGRSVLLLEESEWIGGQMAAAAVSSMDESGPLVRERGIYREFHESMVAWYYSMDKCPYMAYFWGRSTQNQQEGGYEPKVARNMLYGFILDARQRAAAANPNGRLDVMLYSKVTSVIKKRNTITGVKILQGPSGKEKQIACRILVDATEYGDVIPLTGAPYRVGNTKSRDHNLAGVVQDHTYTGVIREYPGGVPEHLKMKTPPPEYEKNRRKNINRILNGDWGLHKGARMYRAELAWRGMADSQSPLVGKASQLRHTLTGLNGGNDYPVTVATIESEEQRLKDEREGILRTLAKIYYLQNELGVPWSVAEDQGFNTPYNRAMMRKRGIPEEFLPIAANLPQLPYVRESRRIEGVKVLVADDLARWENAVHQRTSIAVGDYFMDLHRTDEFLEKDLDDENYAKNGGPFQVPFEAFIPLKLDGFLPAEKNFSQSRLVNGATRLQPITMLTGQAVGVIAALAVEKDVQPRKLNPIAVQIQLLDAGATLIPRWYTDIDWHSELWKATQLLSLYKILDTPGPLEYWDGMEFAAKGPWGTDQLITVEEAAIALKELSGVIKVPLQEFLPENQRFKLTHPISKKEFALLCLKALREHLNKN